MSYRGENLVIEMTPQQLELVATALRNPVLEEMLEEGGPKESKMLSELDGLISKLDDVTSMVNDAGYGYDDNFGQ